MRANSALKTLPPVATVQGPEPLLVDVNVAAKMLGLSVRTVWTYVRSGRIPVVRFGKRVKFSVDALRAWIAAETAAQMGNAG